MHTCCSRNGHSVDRIWPTISQQTNVPRVASEISIGGYSGVSGGEASSRKLKCI